MIKIQKERASMKDSPSFIARVIHLKKFFQKSAKVLDVGCGNGFTTDILVREYNCDVDGFDVNEESINLINQRYPKNNFQVADFHTFSQRKKYDYIICTEVLEHIEDDTFAIRQMHRWLKKNGRIIVSVPCFKWKKRNWLINRHYRHYSKDEIENKLKQNGFKIEHSFIWGSWFRWIFEKIHNEDNKNSNIEKTTKSKMADTYMHLKWILLPLIKLESKITTKFNLRKEGVILIAKRG